MTRRCKFRGLGAVASVGLLFTAPSVSPAASAADPAALEPLRHELGVVGAGVALIDGCRVAWVRGFGRDSAWGGQPVTADTVFQAASIGKTVGALALLRRAEQDHMTVDAALGADLGLQPTEWSRQVSLGQLLSHTAGLSNRLFPRDRTIHAHPGSRFGYSGVGFEVAQEAMERRTQLSAETLARQEVFVPLQMTSASYAQTLGRPASAHVVLGRLGLLLAPLAAGFFLVLSAVIALILRWRCQSWRIPPRFWVASAVIAIVAPVPLVSAGVGWVVAGIAALAVALPVVLGTSAYRWARGPADSPGAWPTVLGSTLAGVLCALLALQVQVPAGSYLPNEAHYAFTLRLSTRDLAKFVAALVAPPRDFRAGVRELTTPVVRLKSGQEWGRGIGVRRGPAGERVLWQWGSNLGFQGLIVAIPDRCTGLVVLTNSGRGDEFAARAVKQWLGIDGTWRVRDGD